LSARIQEFQCYSLVFTALTMNPNRSHISLALASVLIFSAGFTCAATAQSSTPVGKLPITQLQKLAESGDPAAENELGIRYRLGGDVEADKAKAVEWFRKAAQAGYPKAYFNMGAAYYNGDGVDASPMRALVWFLLGKEAGDPSASDAVTRARSEMRAKDITAGYMAIGDEYVQGDILKQDYVEAMRWYKKAVDAGEGAGCERIASLFARGLGVPQDNEQILHWLQRGADLGDPVASYDLGRAYEQGSAVPPDPQKAVTLYENAALYNNTKAMFALGNLYNEGKGVTQDRQKALMWFILAARYGNPDAGKQVAALSAELKPKQVEKAKQDALRYVSFQRKPLALIAK
jgi:TPR repeat protein